MDITDILSGQDYNGFSTIYIDQFVIPNGARHFIDLKTQRLMPRLGLVSKFHFEHYLKTSKAYVFEKNIEEQNSIASFIYLFFHGFGLLAIRSSSLREEQAKQEMMTVKTNKTTPIPLLREAEQDLDLPLANIGTTMPQVLWQLSSP